MSNNWMMGNLLRKSTKKEGEPLGIIYYPCYGKYDSLIFNTNHNFYIFNLFNKPKIKNGQPVHIMGNYGRLPDPNYNYDLVVCFFNESVENARSLALFMQIPLLCIFDSIPPIIDKGRLEKIVKESGNKRVAISQKISLMWPENMGAIDFTNKDEISKLLWESANITC